MTSECRLRLKELRHKIPALVNLVNLHKESIIYGKRIPLYARKIPLDTSLIMNKWAIVPASFMNNSGKAF